MQMTSYKSGIPCWVDLGTTDITAASKFYGELFGWSFIDSGPDGGGYLRATLGDKTVAGLGIATNADMPPYWTTYIAVDDTDLTAKAIEGAGGSIVVQPFDVLDVGRMAVVTDNVGATFSLWQAGKHIGAEIVNEPGSLSWNELMTRDPQKAKGFYPTVFGWEARDQTEPKAYTEWLIDERPVAGMLPIGPEMPEAVPTCWNTYFAVDDCDAAVEAVTRLGGSVQMSARDIEPGRFAVVSDPQGAMFNVIKLNKPAKV